MEILIAPRDIQQKARINSKNIRIRCHICKQMIVPQELSIGTCHIYITHCNIRQEVGLVF